MLAFEDKWVWDFWLAQKNDIWHIYFLQADKSLGDESLRHLNATIGHAVSTDLKNWDYLGNCFKPNENAGWDDMTTWTGSVVEGEQGLWHLFYTSSSQSEKGMRQRIGHATSTDMHHWQRVGTSPIVDLTAGQTWYEEYDFENPQWPDRAMRDPWVIKDPNGSGWLMYFTARVPGEAEANNGGAIGLARSENLYDWTLEAPVYQGNFGQLEVPQVFPMNGRWYCFFCTAKEHWSKAYEASQEKLGTGSHYLVADNPLGPWSVAPGPFFDCDMPAKRYAGKLLDNKGELLFMSFLHDSREGDFIGEISDPIPVVLTEGGKFEFSSVS